jgi:hypothetical protein
VNQYHIGHDRMPIGLRFAFFRFHVRNLYFMWYYNRRNRSCARDTMTSSWKTTSAGRERHR